MKFARLLVVLSLLFRDLNAIAPFITMFYLITYAMINAVVLIEQSMGLVSFRPLLKIPRWVSAAGLLGSLVNSLALWLCGAWGLRPCSA